MEAAPATFDRIQAQDLSSVDLTNYEDLIKIQRSHRQLSDKQRQKLAILEESYLSRNDISKDPLDPIYYHTYENTLPPEQAYRLNDGERSGLKAESSKQVHSKGFKRRYYYAGWNNITPYEREFIQQVKDAVKEQKGIDLSKPKQFGPRGKLDEFTEGENEVVNGRDPFLTDMDILKFIYGRSWDIKKIVNEIYYHLEWRQTNIPLPLLNDVTLNLLHSGLMYLHGRTKDYLPILVVDLGKLTGLMKSKQITAGSFCSLHNFWAEYMINNMMLPGQCDRWVILMNVNKFAIKNLPIKLFKACAKELDTNFIDCSAKTMVVNLTWVQNTIAKTLQLCLNADIRRKQVMSGKEKDPNLKKFVYPSQLQERFGGTAPDAKQFWPPIMPPITEEIDEKAMNLVPRDQYIEFSIKNPGLVTMPKHYRQDLEAHPDDNKEAEAAIEVAVAAVPQEEAKEQEAKEESKVEVAEAEDAGPKEEVDAPREQEADATAVEEEVAKDEEKTE